MCRLSCSVCDSSSSTEEQGGQGAQAKRKNRFRSIEQLKGHLFHQHRLYMCNLCLEGRKVFICEQKLYTRSQLNQHIKSGDSEVDGTEVERSGFAGHPMCKFCKSPFYGDNELYIHMSREHYSCHICQRQHHGKYDYFRNYDDLEMHFRMDHFLCENEECLAKKFIVFQSEAEFKRHNALEHGEHMSRAQRNAALQIPTSFRYQRSEQEQRRSRGRGRNVRPDRSDNDISSSLQNGIATVDHGLGSQADSISVPLQSLSINSSSERSEGGQSSGADCVFEQSHFPPLSDQGVPDARTGPVIEENSFPSLSEQSRYALALSQSSRSAARLGDESFFPPLPGTSNRNAALTKQGLQMLVKNSLASRLQQRSTGTVKVLHSNRPRPPENPDLMPSGSSASQSWPTLDQGLTSLSSAAQLKIGTQLMRENGNLPSVSGISAWNRGGSSTRNPAISGSSSQASSSTASARNKSQEPPVSRQTLPSVEDVHAANKSLVERMQAALGMDKDRYSAFKEISAEYRQGVINAMEYLSHVEQFGLSHLVLEMAMLLPDPQKQKELGDAYYASLCLTSLQENGGGGTVSSKDGNQKKKGKGKTPDAAQTSGAKDSLADNFLNTVKKLQLNDKPQEGAAEVLSKEGYRTSKGEVQLPTGELSSNANGDLYMDQGFISNASGAKQNVGKGESSDNSKKSKKTSKFRRARLGDNSLAALDLNHSNVSPEQSEGESADGSSLRPPVGLPVQGAWRNRGQKHFSTSGKK